MLGSPNYGTAGGGRQSPPKKPIGRWASCTGSDWKAQWIGMRKDSTASELSLDGATWIPWISPKPIVGERCRARLGGLPAQAVLTVNPDARDHQGRF